MKEVAFHPSARAELNASADFYESRLSGLGLRFLGAVEETTNRIVESSDAGAPLAGGFRKRLVPGFPFSIIYRAWDEECLPPRLRPSQLLKRRPLSRQLVRRMRKRSRGASSG